MIILKNLKLFYNIMTTLIILLSTGKGTWVEVTNLINIHVWEKVYIITNEFGQKTFQKKDNMELIVIDSNKPIENLITQIKNSISVADTQVALNLSSGSGKEHMAVLSAILKSGLGIRLITFENKLIEL